MTIPLSLGRFLLKTKVMSSACQDVNAPAIVYSVNILELAQTNMQYLLQLVQSVMSPATTCFHEALNN